MAWTADVVDSSRGSPRSVEDDLRAAASSQTNPAGIIPLVERYVIRGGQKGYERLQILSRARWPETAALFGRAGLRPGMNAVDLGCGGGNVAIEIAALVAPALVTGIDMDDVKLALARKAAAARGLANVRFQ